MRGYLPGELPDFPGHEMDSARRHWEAVAALSIETNFDLVIRSNLSRDYREDTDDNLFVLQEPYEVRPPSDTGLEYSVDEEGTVNLTLNDPIERPEYRIDALIRHTHHQLCRACLDFLNYYCQYVKTRSKPVRDTIPETEAPMEQIPNNTAHFSLPNAVIQHFNLFSLLASVNIEDCYICGFVQREIQKRHPSAIDEVSNLERFRTEIWWKQSIKLGEKMRLYFVMTQPSKPRDQYNNAHVFRMDLWPSDLFFKHFVPPSVAEDSYIYGLSENDWDTSDSTDSSGLAISWLTNCRTNKAGRHDECNKYCPDYLPTRLLDVDKAMQTGMLCLVPTADQPSIAAQDRHYITLSHCWGASGSEDNFLLTEHNFTERKTNGIIVKDLPKTFRHAIQVTRWFKVRWLWIDCLCIIQDSDSDWRREASLMSDIYQNAFLNISADFGSNSNAGCFVERNKLDVEALAIGVSDLGQSWFVTPVDLHIFEWMNQAPSFSRAWIYRERQLARRVLHFTETELVWECCGEEGTGFASEMFPGGAPFTRTFNYDNKYQIGRLGQRLETNAEETYAVWNDVCESLSKKKLTKVTDMPVILSGMSREFAQKLPSDEYVIGLWRSTIPYSLLWHTLTWKDDQDDYFAPSWSWLSASCPIRFASRAYMKSQQELCRVEDIALEFQYDKPFGPLESGSLTIKGVVRRIRLSFGEGRRDCDLEVFDSESVVRSIGPVWDDYEGELCRVELDEPSSQPYLECHCLFVAVRRESVARGGHVIECLLISLADDDRTFRRIGKVELETLYSLKMRYRLVRPLSSDTTDDEFWRQLLETIIPDSTEASHDSEDDQSQDRQATHVKERKGEVGNDASEPGDDTGETEDDFGNQGEKVVEALYQFDFPLDGLDEVDMLERLELQTIVII